MDGSECDRSRTGSIDGYRQSQDGAAVCPIVPAGAGAYDDRAWEEHALARPIGWWLKEADARLNAAFDGALTDTGVDRRGWQVLDSLARGPARRTQLVTTLAAFDPPDVLDRVIDELQARRWVERADDALRLTSSGAGQHAALRDRVNVVRERVRAALPGDDYATLVTLLSRLTAALD